MLTRKARGITRLVNEDLGEILWAWGNGVYMGFQIESLLCFQRWMLFTPQTALFSIWNCIPDFPSDLA